MIVTKETEKQIRQLAGEAQAGFLDNLTGAFFRRIDWWAFWIVSLLTLLVYTYTLAPTVTLEDSGELAVASDFLGVPHPPGYPIWTLLTWFFQWVFHWVTYNGHPNPAWGVGFSSAVSGAFACGLLALLISRSGADLLRSVSTLTERISFRTENMLCLVAGISGGMLLAFSPVLWSQSVIVEVYALNALFQMAVLLLIYMWMCRPKNDTLLYVAAFLFGLGLTNHQTLLFLGLAWALAVLMKDAELFRDFTRAAVVIGIGFILATKGVALFARGNLQELSGFDSSLWKWSRGPDTPQFWVYTYYFLAVPLALWMGKATLGRKPAHRLACGAGLVVGLYLLVVLAYGFFATDALRSAPGFSPLIFDRLLPPPASRSGTPFDAMFWGGVGSSAVAFYWLLFLLPLGLAFTKLPHAKTVAVSILLAEIGVAFYMYLPIASEQNPPMNWGYARTWEGFMHAVTRGQYEAIVATDIFSEKFIRQLGAYLTDLRSQFSLPVAVLGFLPFCAWGFVWEGKYRSVFPAALCLMLGSTLFIVLETLGWGGAEWLYRLLIMPILLMAVWGFCTLVALYLKKQLADMRAYHLGTRVLIGGIFALALLVMLWVDKNALRAVFNAADIPDMEGYLSPIGKLFYLGLVFAPPVAIALAWAGSSAIGLNYELGVSQQRWLITSVVGFFSVSVIFLIFQNPALDIQTLFIGRVQFIQSHALYALWLGYGILLSIAWFQRLWGRLARMLATGVGLLLPGILLWQNACDEEQVRIVGGAEQNGHHFGWQFGNWALQGVDGIKEDFTYWFPNAADFDREWGAYPTPDYPPPMAQGAIFYGGTDPGRFVPTYMIYSADVRQDVYLITQNALADNTFMNITRDLYGDTIYIPSVEDSNQAFQRYVEDVQSGRISAGADIKFENGRVSVQGVGGVMTINGILAQLIFEENKFRHDFYVEESYVIQWMYPYLTPHGIILKLNDEPVPSLDPALVQKDHDFWGWYTRWLLSQSKFTRDICARKSFSKLRSAIAGIYDYRRMYDEAEYAFKQAIDLYPLSPEAIFRLAQMYMNMQRFEEAKKLIEEFVLLDPNNDSANSFLLQITRTQEMLSRRLELEQKQRSGQPLDLTETFDLINIYRATGMHSAYLQLAARLLEEPNIPPQVILSLAGLFAQEQRIDGLVYALEQYIQREQGNLDVWLDLAAAYAYLRRDAEAVAAARSAIQLGGVSARQAILQDPRFQPLSTNRDFMALFPQQAPAPRLPGAWPGVGGGLPNLPGLAR
ncbi:MAG: DUF2723 domain-containing protein [Verrucomicrobiota bacterium]|jgi:tetratricopeptide (TPR) repeat protein|nr:DUF2723 domain-containing protein [Verrucomicrobiota bacterium]